MTNSRRVAAGGAAPAHAYSAAAIQHAVAAGVRGIEHGNLIDDASAHALARAQGYMVPTLVAYESLLQHGKSMGLTAAQLDKARVVRDQGLNSLAVAASAGVTLGFGTDLLGDQHPMQSLEFSIRAQVQPAWDVLRSATVENAEILNNDGEARGHRGRCIRRPDRDRGRSSQGPGSATRTGATHAADHAGRQTSQDGPAPRKGDLVSDDRASPSTTASGSFGRAARMSGSGRSGQLHPSQSGHGCELPRSVTSHLPTYSEPCSRAILTAVRISGASSLALTC